VLVSLAVCGEALRELAVEEVAQLEEAADHLAERRRIVLAWDVRSTRTVALACVNGQPMRR
jgi:hypothetical protein